MSSSSETGDAIDSKTASAAEVHDVEPTVDAIEKDKLLDDDTVSIIDLDGKPKEIALKVVMGFPRNVPDESERKYKVKCVASFCAVCVVLIIWLSIALGAPPSLLPLVTLTTVSERGSRRRLRRAFIHPTPSHRVRSGGPTQSQLLHCHR